MKRLIKLMIFSYQKWQAERIYKAAPTEINLGRLDSVTMQIRCLKRKLEQKVTV